ncbi:unnamed protein product, partial [Ectocarpus sp. 4 AP-2014]
CGPFALGSGGSTGGCGPFTLGSRGSIGGSGPRGYWGRSCIGRSSPNALRSGGGSRGFCPWICRSPRLLHGGRYRGIYSWEKRGCFHRRFGLWLSNCIRRNGGIG